MAGSVDKIYVFSAAVVDFGRIIVSVGENEKKTVDEDIFEILGVPKSSKNEIQELISGYGKRPYATVCGGSRLHPLFVFKDFAFDTSLCLAVMPAVSARKVADLGACGAFEDMIISESLSELATDNCAEALFRNKEEYVHLSRMFGQIMGLMELKLQYTAQSPEIFRSAAESVSELLGISLNFDTYFDYDNEDLVATDEIFDGRFCAAVLLTFAMIAARRSKDATLDVTVINGMGGVKVEMFFKCHRYVNLEVLDHLKMLSEINHGILFDVTKKDGRVGVSFIPLYQDVGFVGVKNGEVIFNIVDYLESH